MVGNKRVGNKRVVINLKDKKWGYGHLIGPTYTQVKKSTAEKVQVREFKGPTPPGFSPRFKHEIK